MKIPNSVKREIENLRSHGIEVTDKMLRELMKNYNKHKKTNRDYNDWNNETD